jgi:putative transposase
MARKVRIEYPGAVYHVMSRGDRREEIFRSDRDRFTFIDTLEEACERAGFLVHAYVLMPNHYHLLLETPEGNLVDGMRWLQATYTIRFKFRNNLVGHVFQGRYKAIPVDSGPSEYFRVLSDYIHLNPARPDPECGAPFVDGLSVEQLPRLCGR